MNARAQWAALRTFHRRVKLVGETTTGQAIFALGPIQLTLPPGAQHFYPIGGCSRCGEIVEFPEPVLSVADLELSGQPHLCQTCARTGIDLHGPTHRADDSVPVAGVVPAAPGPPPAASTPMETAPPPRAPDQIDAVRESQITDLDVVPQPPPAGELERQVVPVVAAVGHDAEQLRPEVEASWGAGPTTRPADSNGMGDAFDRVGEYVALVLRSATMRAEEIRADAERAASERLEAAELKVSEQQAAAALTVEEADRDRDEVMALASQLEETFAAEQQQLTHRLAEAEAQAQALRAAAEAEAAQIRAAAGFAAEHAATQAAAVLAEAEAQAAALRQAAEAEATRLRESASTAARAAESESAAAIALSAPESSGPGTGA